jgi:membrane protein
MNDRPTRSLGELFRALSADTMALLRQEIALAKLEVGAAAKKAAREVGVLGLAGAVVLLGVLVLAAALVLGVGAAIGNYWLGALISGVVLAAVGGLVSLRGLGLVKQASAPTATIEEVQRTARWAGAEVAEVKAVLTGSAPPPRIEAPGRRAITTPAPPERLRLPASTSASKELQQKKSAPEKARAEGGLLKRLKGEIVADAILGHAAQLAYYAFLAMPPALMALFGAAGLVGSQRFAEWLQQKAAAAMPPAVVEGIITPFIEDVVLSKAPGPFSIGLLLALWGASSVFVGLMDALNIAYDVEETRGWVKKRAVALGTMLGSVVLFLLAAVSLLAGPAIARASGLGDAGMLAWNIVQWPLAFAFMVAAFWTGYYVLPNRDQAGCKLVLLKVAAIAAAAWLVATAAFRVYIANFSSYSEAYGFLGAFIILLLWLYLTATVVLVGGELAAEMER